MKHKQNHQKVNYEDFLFKTSPKWKIYKPLVLVKTKLFSKSHAQTIESYSPNSSMVNVSHLKYLWWKLKKFTNTYIK